MAKPLGEPKVTKAAVNGRSTRSGAAAAVAEKPDVNHDEEMVKVDDKAETKPAVKGKKKVLVKAMAPPTTTLVTRAQSAMPPKEKPEKMDGPTVPKTEPKLKAAPKKYPPVTKMPIPRMTRAAATALRDSVAPEANENDQFYDAEEHPAGIKTEDVELEVEQEVAKPVKKPTHDRGRAAAKKVTDVEEEVEAVEEVTKPEPSKPKRGGRKPRQTPPTQDTIDGKDTDETEAAPVAEPSPIRNKRGRPKRAQSAKAAFMANKMEQHGDDDATDFPYDNIKPRGRLQKDPHIKQEEDADNAITLNLKLRSLTLGEIPITKAGQKEKENAIYPLHSDNDNIEEEEIKQTKPKAHGRPRKAISEKKVTGVLDVSGLELAFTYIMGIRDLAMTGDVGDMVKMAEMAEQGMETIQAALDAARDE